MLIEKKIKARNIRINNMLCEKNELRLEMFLSFLQKIILDGFSGLSLSGNCQRAKTGQAVSMVRHLMTAPSLCFRPDNLFRVIQSLFY